ncbi:substrate-binding periplasmic protein [Iodobacter fluviatilis]|uniref:ABC-type amino acid transport substrate-binding protein n=1 Tax=Iodobacter fluviatilis TaxID=537 RepID=A0A377Q7A5_9NEIS|nr:transporter substrate-binding domain-containing protein [Iodobacter fluviatilis]TCU87107.1 ABC-type amino acid transport substrate-binding protein [Iodobacter fluviatilis]STQ90439.1 Bacterial extracellular solute-binding proteins, family 3 [Iodobacter fluviatilis]
MIHPILKALLLLSIIGLSKQANASEFKVDLIQEAPWAFQNPDLSGAPYAGILVDLLTEFTKRSGHTTQITLTPSIRVIQHLKKGSTDFSIMIWNKNNEEYANKGTFLFPEHIGVRAKKGVAVIRYEDLKKITTSVPRGMDIEPEFDADPLLKKDLVQNYMMGVKKTVANRDSQAIAGSLSTINYTIKKLGLTQQFGDTFLLGTAQITIHFSKKSQKNKDEAKVNAIFKEMVDDGTVRDIHSKWMD